jgi:hypothetical protein
LAPFGRSALLNGLIVDGPSNLRHCFTSHFTTRSDNKISGITCTKTVDYRVYSLVYLCLADIQAIARQAGKTSQFYGQHIRSVWNSFIESQTLSAAFSSW